MTNSVGLIDGTRTDAVTAGDNSIFTADITEAELYDFNDATPFRVAYKHAHSQQNPESDWGQNTLQAVRFAFFVLNETYGKKGPHGGTRVVLTPKNTIVIASGVSNGGTGALQAAEQDMCGLIDGVAVTEPNAQPDDTRKLKIVQGNTLQSTIGKPLLDYFTVANLYQPCAALAVPSSVFNLLITVNAQARCDSLYEKGLVLGVDRAAWAADALAKLRAYGWLAESDILHASHYALATNAIAVTYSNALGRVSVLDNLCGYSFANTDLTTGDPIPQVLTTQLGTFSTGNGVPPTSGVNIVYNLAANNSASKVGKKDTLAESPSTKRTDYALDGAICHRNLVEGENIVSGVALSKIEDDYSQRIQEGIDEVVLTARLRGKPAVIVHGRSDALVPVNHSSRAYYGTNQLVEGCGRSRLSYIEVTHAQHFDAFLGFPGYAENFIPLHVYLIRALNDMYDHLTAGRRLPPSQVVRGVPRGPGAPAITEANVPPIRKLPAFRDRIWFIKNTLYIPD
jgi:hydroxybutyrate-dimer hydrolase